MCAGIELDSNFLPVSNAMQEKNLPSHPTFGVALAAFPEAHWSALSPDAPLRRWNLVEVNRGNSLVSSPLHIDERVLHYLAGVQHLDERLAGLVDPVFFQAMQPVPSHREVAAQIERVWLQALQLAGAVLPVVQLCGNETSSKKEIAFFACKALGMNLNEVAANFIPTSPAELDALARLLGRESALGKSAVFLDCDSTDPADLSREKAIDWLASRLSSPLIVSSRERGHAFQHPTISFDVQKPTAAEQKDLWAFFFGNEGKSPDPDSGAEDKICKLVSQFNFNPQTILNAGIEALSRISGAEGGVLGKETGLGKEAGLEKETGLEKKSGLEKEAGNPSHTEDFSEFFWDACRMQARPRLENLARCIEPAAGWDDLVLPEAQKRALHEIGVHVRQRDRVYGSWGFAARSSRGLGITALFSGASGTGKTMAAEVLANELKLDLYRIDLSQVVSKYIGETEKNLSRIFDAAEEGGSILLFDEADALFGKRSEVRDSHDRYANIEVSYLLQRMEAYRGLAILTTNMKNALDPAFLRRIRFVVHFPFPDAAHRAEIWKRVFPPDTPTESLDLNKLARLNVAGGNIYNIALSAAFLAAEAGEPVRMKHILQAARVEYSKLERSLTDAEIGGWI